MVIQLANWVETLTAELDQRLAFHEKSRDQLYVGMLIESVYPDKIR